MVSRRHWNGEAVGKPPLNNQFDTGAFELPMDLAEWTLATSPRAACPNVVHQLPDEFLLSRLG